jgi:hypothetical protein
MPLRDVPQAGMVPESVEECAEELHLAADVVVQPQDPLDQGRLAGAVGAQDGDDLTGVDVHGDVGDDRAVAIPERCQPQRDDELRTNERGDDGPRAAFLDVFGSHHEHP